MAEIRLLKQDPLVAAAPGSGSSPVSRSNRIAVAERREAESAALCESERKASRPDACGFVPRLVAGSHASSPRLIADDARVARDAGSWRPDDYRARVGKPVIWIAVQSAAFHPGLQLGSAFGADAACLSTIPIAACLAQRLRRKR